MPSTKSQAISGSIMWYQGKSSDQVHGYPGKNSNLVLGYQGKNNDRVPRYPGRSRDWVLGYLRKKMCLFIYITGDVQCVDNVDITLAMLTLSK